MNILLLSPLSTIDERTNKGMMIPQLSLFILEGLTPKEHHVKIVEEEYMKVNLEEDCDLVGISCMTANSGRAYYFAQEFKKRGKTVVIGGVHPTILPDEALRYADAVCIGEAEGVWNQILEDVQAHSLKKKYHVPNPDISKYIPKNFSTLKSERLFNIIPIMTSRGCPYKCDFCCVSDLYGKQIRHVPVENVVRDIEASKSRTFLFLDDNIIGQPKYAKELFRAIRPLKIRWVGQASISFAKDVELMRLAADSGCRALFIGLESVCESQLQNLKKAYKSIEELERALKRIMKMGILIHASMIFGFDDDTKVSFNDTVRFLIKNNICSVSFNVLTPYPGTKTFTDLTNAGRIITTDWKYYDHSTVVFKPKNMTPLELQNGKINARKKFYKRRSILKRFWGNMFSPVVYLLLNYGQRKQVKCEKKNVPFLNP